MNIILVMTDQEYRELLARKMRLKWQWLRWKTSHYILMGALKLADWVEGGD
ncbi:MAG: hypothetical protein ACYTFW_20840 [Planctomycetota bacterium]|jgi:hypothetical protein